MAARIRPNTRYDSWPEGQPKYVLLRQNGEVSFWALSPAHWWENKCIARAPLDDAIEASMQCPLRWAA